MTSFELIPVAKDYKYKPGVTKAFIAALYKLVEAYKKNEEFCIKVTQSEVFEYCHLPSAYRQLRTWTTNAIHSAYKQDFGLEKYTFQVLKHSDQELHVHIK